MFWGAWCILPKTKRIETCYPNLGFCIVLFLLQNDYYQLQQWCLVRHNVTSCWGNMFPWPCKTLPQSFRHKQYKENCLSQAQICIHSFYTVLLGQAAIAFRKPLWQPVLWALESAIWEMSSKHLPYTKPESKCLVTALQSFSSSGAFQTFASNEVKGNLIKLINHHN